MYGVKQQCDLKFDYVTIFLRCLHICHAVAALLPMANTVQH